MSRLVIFVLILMLFPEEEAWRRRRRRRWTPPPPQDCTVSGWSRWTACSQNCYIGTQSRTRTVTRQQRWGGSCPYSLMERDTCGSINGGCDQLCNYNNGVCSCQAGYTQSGKKCNDINECRLGPCSHICKNTVGSYKCECPRGYYLSTDSHNCLGYDCGNPAALLNTCPSDSYRDHISSVCASVTASCLQGVTYDEQCSLTCPQNYALAKITAQSNKKFGEDYSNVDFSSVISSITCQKTSPTQIYLSVWDVGDNELSQYYCRRLNDPPVELHLNGSVLVEHSAIGTFIGTLSSQDVQPGQTFMYTVQRPSALLAVQGDKLINMWDDPMLNGNVSLNGGILEVTIRTTDDGVPPMWLEKTFPITVQNVNDPPEQVNLSNTVVYENAAVGTVIGELTALDGDDVPNTDPHSNFKWVLISDGHGKFSINVNKVVVLQSLVPGLFKITVSCSDFGVPVKSTTQDFIINVMNFNYVPHSLQLMGTTVHELAAVGTIVGQLVVIDKDGDDVSFDISQSDMATLNKFEIDDVRCKGTGHGLDNECKVNVTVRSPLNYEDKAWYRLSVQANDSYKWAFKVFNIEVINDNEAPTAINLTGSHFVMENAVAGAVVGQFLVTDPDNAKSPSHQRHTCLFDVSQPSDEKYFIISTGLVLKVKGAQQIDYEKIKSLAFTVVCTDSGNPPHSLSAGFVISVKDANEPPVNLTLSSTTVDENTPLGTPVGILSSDDPDQPGGVHTYSIVGPTGVPFKIGGTNNRTLLVNGHLDHETNPTSLVIVRATDEGGLFTEKTFKIIINDVNDPPSNLTLPTPLLRENSAERVLITSIILTDQDGDLPSCRLLDNAGGRVKVVGTDLVAGPTKTNYESNDMPSSKEFSILLLCSDGHRMFFAKSFFIKVGDVNEAPSDIKLSATSVRENEPDAVVGKVTVSDPDKGQHHKCTVHDRTVDVGSSTGTPSQFFTVDSALNLKTLHALNFEAQHSLDIMINCSDNVTDSLFKTELFTITVKDVNEVPSYLCNTPILVGLKTSVGAVIAVLRGSDPDNKNAIHNDPSNHSVVIKNKQQLTYSLTPAQNSWPFRIDRNSLFKSEEILISQNFTISVEVEDDGIIVESFSSKGYQYTKSKSLSAVFNCTVIVSEHYQTAEILLEPSQVSVTADDGVVIGILSTVSQNPGETFLYELVDEAQLPLRLTGNKLLVAKKDGLDFEVSHSEEALLPISIISKGSVSGIVRESFYVRILDERVHPVNMCLIPHTVNENQPSGVIVGQLIIDDSSSPLLSCAKQHCCPDPQSIGRQFDYQCHVDTPENNEVISQLQRNVSSLFRLDDGFLLRTRVPLLYNNFKDSNGSVEIHFSCCHTRHPLLFIGQSLQVSVADCDNNNVCPDINECSLCQNGGSCRDVIDGYSCLCMSGYTGVHCETNINECQGIDCKNGGLCEDGIASFTCQCADGFSGELCERQPSLCANCALGTLCVTFAQAAIRCLDKQYHIPVLVSETGISSKRTTELEEEIGAILDANRSEGNQGSARKRRAQVNFFYVEILKINQLNTQKQSLLILTALDATNKYLPLLASDACALLANTKRKCVESCEILRLVDLPCGQGGSNKNVDVPKDEASKGLSSGGVAGVSILVIVLVIAILVGAIFYYRRKYKEAKQNQGDIRYQSGTDEIDFSNPIYGDNRNVAASKPSSREWAEKLKKDSDGLVHNNLDPTSVIKRNYIKVSENPLYYRPSTSNTGGREECSKAVRMPEEDDIAAAKAQNKEENPYSEPTDGVLNPFYVSSPPMRGNKTVEPQGGEVAKSENNLNAYLNGANVKVRASNAAQPKKYRRQRSGEKANNEERRSLKNSEMPPSFDNPFYSDNPAREEAAPSDDPTYSTIPALQVSRPCLPPRTLQRLYEAPVEPIEVKDEDDTYEKVNFGDTEA